MSARKIRLPVEWDRYKRLCDQPNVVSRWMLEQTLELLSGQEIVLNVHRTLTSKLACVLAGEPLSKPADHRGGEITDMYMLDLSRTQREMVVRLVRAAQGAGVVTSGTTQRGLGGFGEAWEEYLGWEGSRSETAPTEKK